MFLLKTNLTKYPLNEDDISKRIRQDLESGKVDINFYFDEKTRTLHYECYDAEFGCFSFYVNEEGTIRTSDVYNFFPFDIIRNETIHYIHDNDKKATKEELRKRYPLIYAKYGKMMELDAATYDKYKTVRNNLLWLAAKPEKKMVKKDTPIQHVVLTINTNSPTSAELSIEDPNTIELICDNDKVIDELYAPDSVFSEGTKKILQAFMPILAVQNQIANSSYFSLVRKNPDTYCRTLIHGLYLLGTQEYNDNSVELGYDYYDVDPEIKSLSIKIDENGHIESNIKPAPNDWLLTMDDDTQFLYFSYRDEIVYTYQGENIKAVELIKFLASNPFFNQTDLFMEDIASSLIPKVEGEIQIEQTFLTKALMKTDHVEYFLDLDPVKNVLISSTRYYADEKQVKKEEFAEIMPERISAFLSELNKLKLPEKGDVSDAEVIMNFLSSDLKPLQKAAHVFISDELKKLKKKSVGKIKIIIDSQTDWFSMNFSSDEYTPEEVDAILAAYQKKKKFFLLRNQILDLNEGEGKDLRKILDDIDLKSKRIPIYQSLKLVDCKDIDLGERIMTLFGSLQKYEDSEIHVSESLGKILRPYQVIGVKWLTTLKENHLSGILADDMGLGKTLEMIAFLSQYKEGGPNLIVTPKSLTFNWEDEFRKFDPESEVVVLTADPATRKAKIAAIDYQKNVNYIISYDSLRLDLDLFKDKSFQFLILDEGQYIANALAQKTRAVKSIHAEYKFALTGTPIQNSLMDLWSIFDFLMPGYLKSFGEFKKKYGKLDLDEDDKKHLEHVVSPFLLKRKKDDVLDDLPGKTIITQKIAMNDNEMSLYKAFFIKARNTLNVKDANGKVNKLAVLAALTRLRQICVDPSVFLEYKDISSKLEYTIYVIKEAIGKGHKVLLFSSFTSVLDHIETLFEKDDIRFERIDGDVSAKKRLELANRFNKKDDDLNVMLVSLKAGGTGLNLIGADIVIHLDPWWNVAAEDQASDRAYRIGQTRKVTVYKIVMKDTIEEKVLSLQEKKKDLADIFDTSQGKSNLNEEDLQYLLS